jgi:hypothetical protein
MQYNNSMDTEELLKIFYSDEYGVDKNELSKSLKEVVKYYDKHTRHQYHIISRFGTMSRKRTPKIDKF